MVWNIGVSAVWSPKTHFQFCPTGKFGRISPIYTSNITILLRNLVSSIYTHYLMCFKIHVMEVHHSSIYFLSFLCKSQLNNSRYLYLTTTYCQPAMHTLCSRSNLSEVGMCLLSFLVSSSLQPLLLCLQFRIIYKKISTQNSPTGSIWFLVWFGLVLPFSWQKPGSRSQRKGGRERLSQHKQF